MKLLSTVLALLMLGGTAMFPVQGDGQVYRGQEEGLEFRIDGVHPVQLYAVRVDDSAVDLGADGDGRLTGYPSLSNPEEMQSAYAVIALKKEYLDALPEGAHTLSFTVNSDSGSCFTTVLGQGEAQFAVDLSCNPNTGR